MTDSYRAEIIDAIDRMFVGNFGGRASTDEVFRALVAGLPEHLTNRLIETGLKSHINSYFRAKNDDGLPIAPAADEDNTHVQLELLTIPEFEFVVAAQMKSSRAHRSIAQKIADRCLSDHGHRIDIDAIADAS